MTQKKQQTDKNTEQIAQNEKQQIASQLLGDLEREEIKNDNIQECKQNTKQLQVNDHKNNINDEKNIEKLDGQPSSANQLSKSESRDSSNGEIVMNIEVSEILPSLEIPLSTLEQKFYEVKIPMYNVSSFMKLQTQIYILDVHDPYEHDDYQIERRFSDFLDLYETLFYNHPGHILSPFPDKNFETFFKVKLGIGVNQPSEKCQIIEKRMAKLQKFLKYITHHQIISEYEEVKTFLNRDQNRYFQLKAKHFDSMKQNQGLQKISYMNNLKQTSKSIWSFIRKEKPKPQTIMKTVKKNMEFSNMIEQIRSQLRKIQTFESIALKLYVIENKSAQFVHFDTEIDAILKMCAKQSSSRSFHANFSEHISIIVEELKFQIKWYQEAEKVLSYRIKLCEIVEELKKNKNQETRIIKNQKQIQNLQNRFIEEWEQFKQQRKQKIQAIQKQLHIEWKNHKKKMKKIWRRDH